MRLLGLTATPYRADKKNLGTLFPAFAYRMSILDAIDRGYLVDVRGYVWRCGRTPPSGGSAARPTAGI